MPTMTFLVDVDGELPKNLVEVEYKVQSALNELGFQYVLFSTQTTQETVCDMDKYMEDVIAGEYVMSA